MPRDFKTVILAIKTTVIQTINFNDTPHSSPMEDVKLVFRKGQLQTLSKRNTGGSRAILSTPIKHKNPAITVLTGQYGELWRVLLSRVDWAGCGVGK